MVYGPIGAFLAEFFPSRIRYTSVSVPYHIGNGWAADYRIDFHRRCRSCPLRVISGAGLSFWTTCSYNGRRSYKKTLMKNGKKRRAWTSVQVRELKSMARKKAPAAKIAKKLKRSEGATRQKAFSIGLSLDSRA
jgi:hypothetical protein